MRKLLISLVTLTTLFTACKKNTFEIETLPIEVGEIKNHILNVTQAEKIAILHSMYPDVLSRVNTQSVYNLYGNPKQHPQKQIKSSFALKEGQTNPTLYILNYEEGGFAIVSGDDRMTPILAFSDKGSFEMTEIAKLPPGVKHWISSNHRFIADIRSGKQKEDMASKSLWQDFKDKSELTKGNNAVLSSRPNCSIENEGESYTFNYTNGPLLSTTWGQGTGYNDLIPSGPLFCTGYSNYKPPVGCVGVSIAQIMNFHQLPTTYNWSAMPANTGSSATSALMLDCAESVNTSYGCSGSSATTNATDDALVGFGYTNAVVQAYSFEMAYNNIRFNYPVILAANEGLLAGGHQWVADGVSILQTFVCTNTGDGPIEPTYSRIPPPDANYNWVNNYAAEYLYMNWGWYGVYNAWYSAYVWSVADSDYDYGMKMVRSIY